MPEALEGVCVFHDFRPTAIAGSDCAVYWPEPYVVRIDQPSILAWSIGGESDRGLIEPTGPVETQETQPYPIFSWKGITGSSLIEYVGFYQSFTVDLQPVRSSTEGYVYKIYGYDEDYNFGLLETRYIHKGEVQDYALQVGQGKNFYYSLNWFPEADPPEWHRVE